MSRPFNDISGKRFNKLIAIRYLGKLGYRGSRIWLCRCDCGIEKNISYSNLIDNRITSCGCNRLDARGTEEERFFKKIKKLRNGCWEWTGAKTPDGYGSFGNRKSKVVSPHRWAYEHFIGPIPPDKQLDHICRNRACVNPAHLETVSNKVNILRGIGPTAINSKKTRCPRNHPYDIVNKKGRRECSICNRILKLASYHRRKAPLTRKGWTWRKKKGDSI